MIEDEATFWSEMVERLLSANGEEMILWGTFVEAFYEKYFYELVRDQKEVEFLALTQGSLYVAAYEARFTELSRFVPHITTDELIRAHKFLRDLRLGIRTWLVPFLLMQYADVVNRALVVELDNDDYKRVHEQRKRPMPPSAPKDKEYIGGF